MSSVYRAHDRVLQRHVAIKLLHEQFAGDDDAVERFRREATSVAQVAHENVVSVIDRGEDGRRQFIVFELVDGPNLKEVVRDRGPLPVVDALAWTIQVARALGFAHEQGLVHRDVKPQNVLLAPDGRVKVTDFGIARAVELEGLTQTGTVLGTSEYVAPEQARGEVVGPATDIYALGVVLYELLAGEPPYTGASFVEIAMRHVNDPVPSIRARRPDVPWRLDTAVARALAKRPADRFPSMSAFAAELDACLAEARRPGGSQEAVTAEELALTRAVPALPADGSAPAAAPVRGRSRWPLIAGLAGLAVAATVAMVVAVVHNGGSKKQATPVALHGVGSYDPPPGDGQEHSAQAPLATDGDPATAWSTERYGAALSVIGKQGVGVVVDAGTGTVPSRLVLQTDTPGFTAQILAGTAPGGPFTQVAADQVVAPRTEFSLTGQAGKRYLVVWVTKLAGSVAHVNEVTAG